MAVELLPEAKITLDERVEGMERVLIHVLDCLGLRIIQKDGQLGYQIPKNGPRETWSILAKILHDLEGLMKVQNEKRIIIPGR